MAQHDVYVDDLIGLAQGSKGRLGKERGALFHAIDKVFRKLEPADPESRQEPASIQKLLKGDACCATRKVLLGWLVNAIA